jgi:hypothetical protein
VRVRADPFLRRRARGPHGVDHHDHIALRELVADRDLQLPDGARYRRRHIKRRLIGLQRDQRVVDVDGVAL